MSNGYKAALARFETAVRASEADGLQHPDVRRELEDSRAALVRKLQYRQLAATKRASSSIPATTLGGGTNPVPTEAQIRAAVAALHEHWPNARKMAVAVYSALDNAALGLGSGEGGG